LSAGAARFALVDYFAACCIECRMESRFLQLKMAEQLFMRFMERLLQYELVDISEEGQLKELFSTDSEDRDAKLAVWLSRVPRSAKIDRLKRMQALKQEFEDFPIPSRIPKNEEAADSDALYWRSVLNYACLDAIERLGMLHREKELLRAQETEELKGADNTEPVTKPSPVMNRNISRIAQSFQLVRDRMQVASGVFKPGHNLPTMTIDEYLDLEQKRGNIITGGGEASRVDSELELQYEDTDDYQEAQVIKNRQWDEFKDCKVPDFCFSILTLYRAFSGSWKYV
jgi:immunoglobulin-binding protein 1